jgi:hypothetical protein
MGRRQGSYPLEELTWNSWSHQAHREALRYLRHR